MTNCGIDHLLTVQCIVLIETIKYKHYNFIIKHYVPSVLIAYYQVIKLGTSNW